ncbi:Tricalbin-2, variant 2 [Basidiobolus ranarum]
MEWDVSFTPNDLEDLTHRQLRNKTNPKIVLEVRVGKGFVGAGMPILVEDVSFRGRMRVKMRLMSNFPHMQSVDLCFMEPPTIDYILKPIGGETFGFDISHIPGLSSFIKEQIHAVLGPMMYNPNVFTLNMEQLMSGVDTEAAIGVLKIRIRHARNLKNLEVVGLSDPYVRLNINNRAELGRTAFKQNTLNPSWDETFYILIHDLNETLALEVFDKEEIKKDRSLGTATFNMSSLLDEPNQDNIIAKVIRERGKEHGEVCFDANYYPVIEPIIEEDGTTTQVESNHGILKVYVHQAKDLASKASTKLNPYGVVKLNGTKLLSTKILKRKANPVWEDAVECFIGDRSKAILSIEIKDERGLAVDPLLGNFSIGLNEALKRMEEQNQWFNLNGHASGKVRLSFVWKPVEIKGGVIASGHLAPPTGVVRLDIIEAKNLKNVEKIGKSDPYVIVSVSGRPLSRTEVIDNNLNPSWNETHYIGVRSPREVIYFDVYDFDKVGKDRLLGSTSIPAQQILGEQINEHQWGPGAPKDLKLNLHLEGKEKGEIHVKASYNPFIELDTGSNLAGPQSQPIDQSLESSESPVDTTTDTVPLAKPIDYTQYSTGLLSIIVGNTRGMRRRSELVYAEVLLNSNEYNVVHRTKPTKRALNPSFDEECEVFIQEAQFATITIYLREQIDERSIVARKTIDLPTILEQLSNGIPEDGFWYEFENTDGKIQLFLKFSPVEIQIDESESWINKGLVMVKILKAEGLRAADSSGTSDPYIVVTRDGEKVHKTKVIKKTLSPVYNEEFSTLIHARNESSLVFNVYDWNQVQTHEQLGYFQISTKNLEPLTWIQDDYSLTDGTGTVSLKIMFRPEHVGRMTTDRKQTFQAATKSVIGKGVGGATRAVGGTLGGISKGVSGLLSLGKKTSSRGSISAPRPNTNMPQEASSTRSNSISSSFSNNVRNSSDVPNSLETPNMPNMPNMPEKPNLPNIPETSSKSEIPNMPYMSNTPSDSAYSQASVDDIKAPITPVSPKFSLNIEEEAIANVDNNIERDSVKKDLSGLFSEAQVGSQLTTDNARISSPSSINEPENSFHSLSAPQSPMSNRSSIANLDDFSEFSGESDGEHGFLTVEILQAKDLIAANSNGSSNPYVRVRSDRKTLYKTKVCKKTLEPKWNERFTIPVRSSSIKLHFSVRDRNLLQDSYLGEYEANVSEHIQLNSQVGDENWVELRKTERGKLLLKFTFISNTSPRSSEVFDSLTSSAKKKLGFSSFRRKL